MYSAAASPCLRVAANRPVSAQAPDCVPAVMGWLSRASKAAAGAASANTVQPAGLTECLTSTVPGKWLTHVGRQQVIKATLLTLGAARNSTAGSRCGAHRPQARRLSARRRRALPYAAVTPRLARAAAAASAWRPSDASAAARLHSSVAHAGSATSARSYAPRAASGLPCLRARAGPLKTAAEAHGCGVCPPQV